MQKTIGNSLARAVVLAAVLWGLGAPAQAQISPEVNKKLEPIFAEAKGAFFGMIGRILQKHPMKDQLGDAELARVLNGQKEIPYLFERLMVVAYQKDEPLFTQWAESGDAASLEKFRKAFVALAEEYAARFVGSLFRKTRQYDFEISLPHNRGKSRLDLVLQSIGFNARNDRPEIPKEQWFTNRMKPEYGSQWAIDALNVRPCWPMSKGAGVVVAVIDSGLDPYNSLFKDRTVPGFSFQGRTTPPWSDENPPMIDWGMHGTGCSSALLAVAPDCKIMPVRVHDGDTMNDPVYDYWVFEFVAAGIYYAVHHGAQVISLSAPLPATELPLLEAAKYAYRENVPICTSAGNISRIQFGLHLEDQIFKAMKKEVILAGGVAKEGDVHQAVADHRAPRRDRHRDAFGRCFRDRSRVHQGNAGYGRGGDVPVRASGGRGRGAPPRRGAAFPRDPREARRVLPSGRAQLDESRPTGYSRSERARRRRRPWDHRRLWLASGDAGLCSRNNAEQALDARKVRRRRLSWTGSSIAGIFSRRARGRERRRSSGAGSPGPGTGPAFPARRFRNIRTSPSSRVRITSRTPRKAVDLVGGIARFIPQSARVAILPNSQSAHPGTFTKPDIVRAVVRMCKSGRGRARSIA